MRDEFKSRLAGKGSYNRTRGSSGIRATVTMKRPPCGRSFEEEVRTGPLPVDAALPALRAVLFMFPALADGVERGRAGSGTAPSE